MFATRSNSHIRLLFLAVLLGFCAGCNPTPSDKNDQTSGPKSGTATSEASKQTGKTPVSKPNSLRAEKLFDAGKVDEAWDECQRVLVGAPGDARALLVAGAVMQQRNKIETALQLLDRVPIDDREYGLRAARLAAKWTWENGDLLSAAARAEKLLAKYPNDVETLSVLAANYDLQGRRYEAAKINQHLIRLGKFNIMTLVLAVDTVKPLEGDAQVAKLAEKRPNDAILKSLTAFGHIYSQQPELAEAAFREMLKQPNMPAACHVGLGVSLVDQEKFDEIPAWLAQVPRVQAESIPSYWRVLGLYYKHQQEFDSAVYCLTRSAELDPFDFLALGPLSQVLAINQDETRAAMAESLFQQNQLTNRNVNYIRDGFRRNEWMLQIADAMEHCGRQLEAVAWREMCEQSNEKRQAKLDELQGQRRALAADPVAVNFANKTNFSWQTADLKRPEFEQIVALGSKANANPTNRNSATTESAVNAKLFFADRASELGAVFQYNNGDDLKVAGMQTYQSNGAGASVLDFDNDGWPDLYVLQGGGDPREKQGHGACALFRNLNGQRFVDVAANAHVTNMMYGQGAAVGDWDQDGFADLFVLNFGENRLLKNMGDGTFAEVALDALKRDMKNAPVWSVSGAIADLNGDNLPDIVEINYSSGIDAITHLCHSPDGEVQVCRPTEFPASPDFIYLSDGQGGFQSTNAAWKLPLDDGRGLGLIVGNLDQNHGNDIYISNDMSANHLLVSYPNKESSSFTLREEAVRRGCAVDIYGKPQASMGIGCSDVDRNGTFDLFMTNFLNEYNAMYLQSKNGTYEDASRRYKLTDPNKNTLGFGTQLIDLDLDGWSDALIVNGHVEDYSKSGKPFRMRPQVLLQRSATFVEQSNDALGEFFTRECLGRGLGLFDFNRDGRTDFYATHLDRPLAIVENQSVSSGAWLQLELIGTQSERDAIGATIAVQSGEQKWLHQRLAGNGFECSNEAYIALGLGNVQTIDTLEIRWPSGKTESFQNVAVNQRLCVIEGQGIQ